MINPSFFPVLIEEVETNRLRVVWCPEDLPVISPIRIRGTCLEESEADLIRYTISHYENLNRPNIGVPVEICRALAIPMNSQMKDAVEVIESLMKQLDTQVDYQRLFERWRSRIIERLNFVPGPGRLLDPKSCLEDVLAEIYPHDPANET